MLQENKYCYQIKNEEFPPIPDEPMVDGPILNFSNHPVAALTRSKH